MHALHSLAHRAPPATRTRVRWQPYSSIPSACSTTLSRSSPASYLNTPSSSVTSSPQICNDHDRIRQILSTTSTVPKDVPNKDTPRNKYITSLVDQAVKSLSEIWRPQDIPPVFVASAHTIVLGGGACENSLVDPKLPIRKHSRGNLVPIKSFVHEVLRRSRTSGCVLQTALCYLEAIRSKVPELVRAEKAGEGVQGEVDRGDWITPASPEELELERELAIDSDEDKVDMTSDDSLAPTVRVDDINRNDSFSQSFEHLKEDNPPSNHQRLPPGPKLPPLPPLPSPLLCPRRAFLASLILASKFTQDKCYSNRAWAKLSGLPPREIGRCERALGEALDWRLWVGKQPSAVPPSPPLQTFIHRPLARVQSEGCLNSTNQGPFLVHAEKVIVADSSVNRGLRRHRTLPADAFIPSSSTQISLDQVPWHTSASSFSESDILDDAKMNLSGQSAPTEPSMVVSNKINQSTSPSTPSLTYSPSSTDSCSGDRTVQMSSFSDEPTATFNPSNTNGSESWPWLDNSDVAPCLNIVQSIWINRKISPSLGDPFSNAPSIDLTGIMSSKMTDIDGGSTLYPLVSENCASAYPSHW
ncbi:G1/S-specific cyclin pas1 [Termitomyces sp. J132]|nr:G1/S-specific cyclin pas1 [Termitomyces sp. J132]